VFKEHLRKIVVFFLVLLVGIAGFTILSSGEKVSNKRDNKPVARKVETYLVEFTDVTLTVEGQGVIESQRNLDIVSEVSGRLEFTKNNLKSGTFVASGEMIVQVDKRQAENNLFSQHTEFMKAISTLLPILKVEGNSTFDKWNDYFSQLSIDKPIPDLPDVDDLREKLKVSNYGIFSRYYAVKNAEIALSKYTVLAPFDGYIISENLIRGSFVSPGQKIFSLIDAVNLEISIPLLVEDAGMIDLDGSPGVKVYTDDDKSTFVQGQIIRKDSNLDRNSQTINVYVGITTDNKNPYLLPGNFVNVEILGRRLENVARIPRHTVRPGGFVYCIKDNLLATLHVNVIHYQQEYALITDDISDKTRIITTILQKPLIGMQLEDINQSAVQDSVQSMQNS